MAQSNRLNIVIEDEAAIAFVRSKVASGEYASEAEVVRQSLETLREEAEELAQWEREIILPAYERITADPSSAIPLEQVREELRANRSQRLKAS